MQSLKALEIPQQQPQESNQEHDDSAELEATVIQSEEDREGDEDNENSAVLSTSQLAQRSKQDAHEPHETSEVLRGEKKDTPEAALVASDPVRLSTMPPSSLNVPLDHPSHTAKLSQHAASDQPHTSSTASSSSFSSLVGYEDASLGDLFKYAVVIAGPTALPSSTSNAQQPALVHPRKMFADFRRTRSLPEGQQQHQQQRCVMSPSPIPEDAPLSQPQTVPSRFRLLSPPRSSRLTPRQPQTLLEFISEDQPAAPPSPTPQRKPGWLSNLVAHRFRGTSPPVQVTGATTVEAPARLTTVPSEFDEHAVPAPIKSSTPALQASKMLCVYPPQTKEVAELEGLVELCFPYGDRMPPASDFTIANLKRTLQERHRTYRSSDSTFVLTIASASNPCEITYAICVICPLFAEEEAVVTERQQQPSNANGDGWSPEPRRPSLTSHPRQCCLCLLSPYPFFGLFFKVLFGVAVRWESKRREFGERYALALRLKHDELPRPPELSDFVSHFHTILANLKHMRIPSMGGWSRMSLAPELTQLSFHRPHSESIEMERRVLLLEYAAPTLFALLSVDQVLFLLGCLCCEHKVLVVSDHVNIVSSCVLALITLLSPLQWAGPVITVLPPRLDELLEAPVPLIAGRVSIASAPLPSSSTLQRPMKGVIEVNMDQNSLCMHDEDLGKYHELKLPGCDALVHELKYFSSQLFEKHASDSDFPNVQQAEASEIICTRIHRHLKFICSLALSHSSDTKLAGTSTTAPPTAMPVADAVAKEQPSESARRCSDLTLDYIQRFKETQMFSMFRQKREQQQQQQRTEEDDDSFVSTAHGDEDDDDVGGDDSSDDDDDALTADACATEQLFACESISYEPDALCFE